MSGEQTNFFVCDGIRKAFPCELANGKAPATVVENPLSRTNKKAPISHMSDLWLLRWSFCQANKKQTPGVCFLFKVKTIAYAGSIVYSSGSIIFSSFNKRFAFQDSKFLIHQCIPPKGTERTKIFEEYDRQIWQFMSERMEISLAKIEKIAKKGERMTSKQALDIGLVDEIIDSSWRDFKDLVIL